MPSHHENIRVRDEARRKVFEYIEMFSFVSGVTPRRAIRSWKEMFPRWHPVPTVVSAVGLCHSAKRLGSMRSNLMSGKVAVGFRWTVTRTGTGGGAQAVNGEAGVVTAFGNLESPITSTVKREEGGRV